MRLPEIRELITGLLVPTCAREAFPCNQRHWHLQIDEPIIRVVRVRDAAIDNLQFLVFHWNFGAEKEKATGKNQQEAPEVAYESRHSVGTRSHII